MRKGSVAIVPIFLAIALIFWAIWFMGQESDNTHVITTMQKLERVHENAAIYAMKKKVHILEEAQREELTEDEKKQIQDEVQNLMQKNRLQ